jgi:MFS family permease
VLGLGRNVLALAVVSFLTDVSSEMIYPLLPLFLTATLGASAQFLGAVEGAAESTAALLKLASGWWSDRVRRRKPLVLIGYGMTFDRPGTGAGDCVQHPLPLAVLKRGDAESASPFFEATGVICSLPALSEAAGASGFLNAAPDPDGLLRRPVVTHVVVVGDDARTDGQFLPELGPQHQVHFR